MLANNIFWQSVAALIPFVPGASQNLVAPFRDTTVAFYNISSLRNKWIDTDIPVPDVWTDTDFPYAVI